MPDIIKRSFKINLSLLTAFALYPSGEITMCFKMRAYFMYISCTILVSTLGSLVFLLEENLTETQINNDAFFTAEMACQVIKLLPFVINPSSVKRCIHYFEKSEFKVHRNDHERILESCSSICRRNSMIFIVSIVSGNVFWAIKPFFSSEQTLPADIWLPWNFTSESVAVYLIYIYLIIAALYTSLACVVIDSLIAGLVCLATGQLKILKNNLQHLNKYAEEYCQTHTTSKAQKAKIIYNFIEDCVQHHNSILNFFSEFEKCFSLALFGQCLGSIIVIGFCCLQLSKLEPLTYNFFSFVSFLWIFLAEIYVYCYYGTALFEESNSLTNAIYMGEWYEFDSEARKALIILMERSKKPIIVTAGKIMVMSVETFTKILKSTYSLLAVLKNQ